MHRLSRLMASPARAMSPSRMLVQQQGNGVQLRFLATAESQQKVEDSVLERYKTQLEAKARAEGRRLDELREAAKAAKTERLEEALVVERPSASTSTAAASTSTSKSSAPPGVRTLSSFVDVPKLLPLPAAEVSKIWIARHASNPSSLSAVVPGTIWTKMRELAKQFPMFVLPVPAKATIAAAAAAAGTAEAAPAAEMHLMQWTYPSATTATVLFTRLAQYQLRGEYAPVHTTLTHHTDLLETHGVVLVSGTVDAQGVEGGVGVQDAQLLALWMQKFYTARTERAKRLLELFGIGDASFRVEDVLEECERLD